MWRVVRKRLAAEQRRRLSPLKKQIAALETTLEKLQAQNAEVEVRLADSALYEDSRKAVLKSLLLDQQALKANIDRTEEEWLVCHETLEQLGAAN